MIGPAIEAALPLMRAQAESLMVDTCDIHRATTGWDEALQKTVTTWVPVHLSMPCHFEQPSATSRTLLTDQVVTPETPTVKGPVSFDGIEPDDRVTVTAVGVMWVTHVPRDTHPVERVIECRWVR